MPNLLCLTSIVLLAALQSSGQAAENWPQFRGLGGNASASTADVPLTWSSASNIVWKTELPGRGSSSPIVWGDRIYLTAYTGLGTSETNIEDKSKLRFNVICCDRKKGDLIWDRSVPADEATQDFTRRIQDHGYASSTPATDGDAVYAFFGVTGVVAFSRDGEIMWHRYVGSKTAGFGSASSPIVFEDLVIVNASIESDSVFGLNKQTGEVVWEIPNIKKAWTTPCVAKASDGDYELVVNQKDVIYGFDPRTGKQLWECAGIDDYVVPIPVSHDGIVYCLGGRTNRSIAVRLGGRGEVTESHKLWEVNVGANVTSPLYYDGHLYWASDRGIANCLDVKTGQSVYQNRLKTRGRVYASIVRGGENLFVTTRDVGVIVLEAKPEYKELHVNTIDTDTNMVNASPAIVGDLLLMRTDAFLYCIGKLDRLTQAELE